jgi:heme/copper-type cytochrome/quinol oxidase subunit 2
LRPVAATPIKALVWSAIVTRVISVLIMAALMWIGQSERLMGRYTISERHRFFGWAATAVMAVAVVTMLVTGFLTCMALPLKFVSEVKNHGLPSYRRTNSIGNSCERFD